MIIGYVCQDISNVLCQQQAVLDLKITDFWDVTVLYKYKRHFQETNCPHLQVERLKFYVTLKMQAVGLSWMLVCFHRTVYCSVFVLTAIRTAILPLSHSSGLTSHRPASVSAVQILRCVSCISVHFQTDNAKILSTCHHLYLCSFEHCTTEHFHTINEKVGCS